MGRVCRAGRSESLIIKPCLLSTMCTNRIVVTMASRRPLMRKQQMTAEKELVKLFS